MTQCYTTTTYGPFGSSSTTQCYSGPSACYQRPSVYSFPGCRGSSYRTSFFAPNYFASSFCRPSFTSPIFYPNNFRVVGGGLAEGILAVGLLASAALLALNTPVCSTSCDFFGDYCWTHCF